jgi:hypothetical protein
MNFVRGLLENLEVETLHEAVIRFGILQLSKLFISSMFSSSKKKKVKELSYGSIFYIGSGDLTKLDTLIHTQSNILEYQEEESMKSDSVNVETYKKTTIKYNP